MRRLTMIAIGTLALGGCTGAHITKPAVCDGKHRRPANIYGSVLPTLPLPVPPSQAGQSMVAPGPAPGPGALPAPPAGQPAPPTPAPDAGTNSAPSSPSAATTLTPAPRTSQREIALSYLSC